MRSRRTSSSYALLVLALAGCFGGDDGDSATAAGTTTTEPECTTQCVAEACEQLECDAGNVCRAVPLPDGARDDDIYGDCRALVCDGGGGYSSVIDVGDPPFNMRRDCQRPICEDDGAITLLPDETDRPNDGLECTEDACDGATPTATPLPINTACDAQSYCHADGSCQRCPAYTECVEPGPEPNDSQAEATQLGMISDNDADGGTVCGVLSSPTDVDWYVYGGLDKLGNVVDPTRTLTAAANARLCVYARCTATGTSISCLQGAKDTAPQGQNGCCGAGKIAPYVNCEGLDDSMTVWIKVENNDALACLPYQLDYHF
jgi:hypothetical protein